MKYYLILAILFFSCNRAINVPASCVQRSMIRYKEYGFLKREKVGFYDTATVLVTADGYSFWYMKQYIYDQSGAIVTTTDSVKYIQFWGSPYRFFGYKESRNFYIKD